MAAAPDSAGAQFARGETAEILGEYGEARAAYGQARALSGSFEATLGEGELAARIGDVETAVRLLATATPPRRRSATFAFFGGAATSLSIFTLVAAPGLGTGSFWTIRSYSAAQ